MATLTLAGLAVSEAGMASAGDGLTMLPWRREGTRRQHAQTPEASACTTSAHTIGQSKSQGHTQSHGQDHHLPTVSQGIAYILRSGSAPPGVSFKFSE